MNEAKTKLDEGNLNGAIESVLSSVKNNPTDIPARTFLFELSCYAGDWERAERQLDVIGHQDVNAMIGSQIYKQNLRAERSRARYFSDGLKPEFLSPPPSYVEDLLEANNRLREGNMAQAREILDKVEEERPAFACRLNGEEKEDFRDYNDLTMCVFEAILKESYVWLPMEQIRKIEFFAPKSLRDLFWIQGKIELDNGLGGEMFLPALYVNSWKSQDDLVRLGRKTDWRDLGEEVYIGEGLREFFTEGEAKTILELNEIEFVKAESQAAA